MEVNYINGNSKLEQVSEEGLGEKLNKELADKEVKSVTIHKPGKPGSTVRMSDGTEYIVDLNGSMRKLAGKKS